MGTDNSAKLQGDSPPGLPGHERSDASAGWIFGIVGFLIVSGVIMHFLLGGMLLHLKKKPPPRDQWNPAHAETAAGMASSFPRLQVFPTAELEAFRTREESALNTYGWIDKTAGVVRIPIDRAMQLVLEKGLPVRTGTNGSKVGISSYELIQPRPLQRETEDQGRP